MRSMTCVLALCLLAGLQLAAADEGELPANYKDAVTEGAKIVYADPNSRPVGFDKTSKAIVDMLALMSSREYIEDVNSNEFMAGIKKSLERFKDACELNKAKCLSVFPAIDALKEENGDNLNIMPYLRVCEQRQSDFCSGRDSEHDDKPNAVVSFFTKIATVCSPKDKNCDKKNKH